MNCFPELTYAVYADGELEAVQARQLEAHLAGCDRCRTLVEALRAENRVLAGVLQETDEAAVPLVSRPALGLLWTALGTLAAAAGLQAALDWVAELSQPAGLAWLNPLSLAVQLNLFFSGLFYFINEGAAMLGWTLTTVTTLALGLLVVAGSLFVLRRRPRALAVFVTLALALGLALPSAALEKRVAKRGAVTVAKGETVDDTLVATAETVIVDGIITGNLIAFAERVRVNGTVKGDLISVSRGVNVDGTVEGNVFSFAQTVNVHGQVVRGLYAFAQRITLEREGRVEGDLVAAGEEVDLEGTVGRDAHAYGSSVELQGTIGRHLTTGANRVTLFGSARVVGDLRARLPKEKNLHIDPGASIAGKKEVHLRAPRPSRYLRLRFYLWQVVRLAGAFLTGLLLFWLFPFLFAARLDTAGALLRTAGVGFLVLAATPVAVILAGITVVGLPVALLSLALYLAGLYLAKVFVAVFVGQALLRSPGGQIKAMAVSLLAGLAILFVATNLPYVGGWLSFLVILLGLGIALTQVRSRWQQAS